MSADLVAELRRAWLRSGLTLAVVGERMGGRHPQGVHDLLNGRRDVRLSSLLALADALGYDLALIPKDEPDEVVLDLEPAPSAETIASVMAIVDAPYQPGLDARYADAEDLALIPREDTP